MIFKDYLNKSWNDHATDTQAVAASFQNGIELIETEENISQMANLICHVFGEHLGQWQQGLDQLHQLSNHVALKNKSALERFIVSMELSSGNEKSLLLLVTSDRVRALSLSASALADKDLKRSLHYLSQATELANSISDQSDPAFLSLAITGNNLAATLEEKDHLNPEQKNLMIHAALTGRKYWEIAGTWLQIERAEYRLAMSYLKASDAQKASQHAKNCLQICLDNRAEPLEFFFAYEVVALTEKALGNAPQFQDALQKMRLFFNKLSDSDQSWCQASFEKFEQNH